MENILNICDILLPVFFNMNAVQVKKNEDDL